MGLVKKQEQEWDGVDRRVRDRDTASLLAALGEADPDVRRRATLDLSKDRHGIPALLAAYPRETDPAVREAMLTVLAEHDVVVVARAFADDLADDDVVVRNAAATALESMPGAVALLIDELLRDPCVRTRTMAMTVLAGLQHPDVPTWLADVVGQDNDENVVAAAVDAALAAGDETGELLEVAVRRFPDNPYLGFLAEVSARKP
jgi:HEAT repeat protein